MKTIATMLMFVAGFSAFGAYPPFPRSALYINAILANKEVVDSLGIMNSIDSVSRHGDTYTIMAGKCVLPVTIKPKSSTEPVLPSPIGEFDLEIGTLKCD